MRDRPGARLSTNGQLSQARAERRTLPVTIYKPPSVLGRVRTRRIDMKGDADELHADLDGQDGTNNRDFAEFAQYRLDFCPDGRQLK